MSINIKVYKQCCKNCLLSTNSIVSNATRKEIIQSCIKQQTHFICHKASLNNQEICCKKFYDELGHHSKSIKFSQWLNIIDFIEQPEHDKLIAYKELNK